MRILPVPITGKDFVLQRVQSGCFLPWPLWQFHLEHKQHLSPFSHRVSPSLYVIES